MNNKEYSQNIYERLRSLGLAVSTNDFSFMCGRTPTWFSSIKTRDLPFTTQAALTLCLSIRERLEGFDGDKQAAMAISEELLVHAGKMAKLKQQQHLACPQ